MATIRTAFALTDQMTRPIQHINSAMGILINSMESMSHTMGTNLDTSALEEARNYIANATAAFDQLEDEINQAGQQQERLNQNIRAGQSAADGLLRKFTGIAATIGGMMGLKQLVGLSDDLAGTRARLNLIVDDGGSVADLEKKIMASAQRSRAAYFDTANAIASMLDIAEREAINRFTTAQITVEQHNENHIDSDTDLDGIMDVWAADFAEKLDVSEEGVN